MRSLLNDNFHNKSNILSRDAQTPDGRGGLQK